MADPIKLQDSVLPCICRRNHPHPLLSQRSLKNQSPNAVRLNSVNCVILTAVLALTLLSYLVVCCVNLALGLGGLAPDSDYTRLVCRCANSRLVHLVLQILALVLLVIG